MDPCGLLRGFSVLLVTYLWVTHVHVLVITHTYCTCPHDQSQRLFACVCLCVNGNVIDHWQWIEHFTNNNWVLVCKCHIILSKNKKAIQLTHVISHFEKLLLCKSISCTVCWLMQLFYLSHLCSWLCSTCLSQSEGQGKVPCGQMEWQIYW